MEESAEKRRERLRAMREVSFGYNDEESPCIATSSESARLPLLYDIQQPAPHSPSLRFEFYTDPLAAFNAQRMKKPKNSLVCPLVAVSGSPTPSPCQSSPSPLRQRSPGCRNLYANLPPPGSFSTPGPSNYTHSHSPNPKNNPNFGSGKVHSGSFSTPNSILNHSNPTSSKFSLSSTPPVSCTPGSAGFNPMVTPQGGFSNPGPSMYGQQLPSAFQVRNGAGSGGSSLQTMEPHQYNQIHSLFSSDFTPQDSSGSVTNPHHNGWSQGSMSGSWSQGSNHSPGRFKQSSGSYGRSNKTPGRSGGRGFQRNQHEPSASTNPELFTMRSMLSDPWKDLVPVRIETVAFRLNSCSVAASREWLPKSVNKGIESLNSKEVTFIPSGPSLAESLAASFADGVAGKDVT